MQFYGIPIYIECKRAGVPGLWGTNYNFQMGSKCRVSSQICFSVDFCIKWDPIVGFLVKQLCFSVDFHTLDMKQPTGTL